MPKPILDYRDDDSPLWPARCRGYLEGKRASDCLANVELARLRRGPCDICRNWYREVDRLRAENERLRAALGAVEWLRTGHGGARCPSCGYYFGELDHKRHSHDCPLAAALKAEP